jgi:uncharacterized membrane protein YccC
MRNFPIVFMAFGSLLLLVAILFKQDAWFLRVVTVFLVFNCIWIGAKLEEMFGHGGRK